MAKKVSLSEISDSDLIEELKTRLENAASGTVEFPSDDQIAEMETEDLDKTAASINMDVDDLDDDEKKRHLTTVFNIGAKNEVDEKDVRLLCAVLGIKADKKDHDKNCEAVLEYLNSDKAEAAEKAEDADEEGEEDADAEEESPKKKSKKPAAEEEEDADEDADADAEEDDAPKKKKKKPAAEEGEEDADEESKEVDSAAIVAAFEEYPKEKIMLSRLAKHNEAAETEINIKKLGAKKAYAKLLELMVDDEGEIADWGQPYIREEEGYCCGLAMTDHKIKGEKGQFGKCVVTEKVFSLGEDGKWEEVEAEEEAE